MALTASMVLPTSFTRGNASILPPVNVPCLESTRASNSSMSIAKPIALYYVMNENVLCVLTSIQRQQDQTDTASAVNLPTCTSSYQPD